jgi:hypothetical protein
MPNAAKTTSLFNGTMKQEKRSRDFSESCGDCGCHESSEDLVNENENDTDKSCFL